MTGETIRCEVAVAGGGLAGLTLAAVLSAMKIDTVLIEARPFEATLDESYDGRTTAIAFASARIYRALGMADALGPDRAEPIRDILVTDGRLDPVAQRVRLQKGRLRFDHRDLPEGEPLGFIVENRRLRLALLDVIRASQHVRILNPARIETSHLDDSAPLASLHLEDGRVVQADLVAAADGRNSPLRKAAGVDTYALTYGQTALVATVKHSEPHHGLAQELFLPPGPFAVLPMTNQRSSVVWTEREREAKAYMALDEADFLAEMDKRLTGCLGTLQIEGGRHSYPLTLTLARRFRGPRMVLMSEAAHRIHPIAGQGLNVGLRDVATLADVLAEQRSLGLDVGAREATIAYERRRRFDAATLGAATDGLNRLFSNASPILAKARGLGLAGVERVPPLKRFFMREAGGAVGSLPALLRGEWPKGV